MDRLISLQAAIDVVTKHYRAFDNDLLELIVYEMKRLPSAQPERKTGKWIGTEYAGYADGNPVYYEWKCSACGCVIEDDEPTWNFCPNCGADMRGEQND